MKIGLVIPSFYPATVYGGPIFSTLHAAEELAKLEGVEVYVSSTNANMTKRLNVETNKWILFQDDFYVKYYNETKVGKFSFALLFNLWRDIKKADVIHIQSIFSTPTPIALFYAKLFKKPALLSPRGQFGSWCLENGSGFKQKWLNWFIRPFANKIIWHATADQEKNEILAIFPNAKVEVIPNGVEYDLFQKSDVLSKNEFVNRFLQKEADVDKIIISMGRLQKKKGFDILIDSFAKVIEKQSDILLCIAGPDEGERINLEQQIEKLGLDEKVFLVGSIEGQDKIDFLANADLFVLPSHNENFGNVYIESLAVGTPIIASKNTPWEEVEEAGCGKWVNNSVDETMTAIIDMLQNDREIMRTNSRLFAKKYDWKNIAVQFKKIFEEMLGE